MVCAIAEGVHLASVVQALMLSWPLVRDAVGLRGTVIDEAVSRLRRHARAAFRGIAAWFLQPLVRTYGSSAE